jgi:H+/Cl- antiporter ClcA
LPKIRNPIETWLLTAFTSGIYALLWVWKVGQELNTAEGTNVFKLHLWRLIACILFPLVLLAAIISINSGNPTPVFVGFFVWGAFLIYVQIQIGNYIKHKDRELGLGLNFSNAKSIMLMYLVANYGMAYIQHSLNKVIQNESWAS